MKWKFLIPPVFQDDEEKTNRAASVHQIVLVVLGISLLAFPIGAFASDVRRILWSAGLLTGSLSIISFVLNRRGKVTIASYIAVATTTAAFIYVDYTGHGASRPLMIFSVVPIFISGMLLGARATLSTALTLGLAHAIFAYMKSQGLYTFEAAEISEAQNVIVPLFGYLSAAAMLRLAIGRIENLLKQAKTNEQTARQTNEMLEEAQQQIQEYVIQLEANTLTLRKQSEALTQQTKELQEANRINSRRAMQFQAVTEIARAIIEVRTLDELLPLIARTVSEKLGHYHTGIFLIDSSKQFAVLAASNSEGGQRMLQRGHQLEVGKTGIVGNVAASGFPRIALDVGEDITFFNNPDLPNTRSEIALPLIAEQRTIGVLDVQSTQPNAFDEEDIKILSTLTAQIGEAIEGVRRLQETQRLLTEAQSMYRQFIQASWAQLIKKRKLTGLRYDAIRITPAEPIDSQEAEKIAAQKIVMQSSEQDSSLTIPILLRGETIGILDIQTAGKKVWTNDEIDLAQAIADRIAIATENAWLFEQTTERAERERKVSEITSKIRSTNDPDEMIQIAINELKQTLSIKDVRILPYKPAQGDKG